MFLGGGFTGSTGTCATPGTSTPGVVGNANSTTYGNPGGNSCSGSVVAAGGMMSLPPLLRYHSPL